MEPKLFFTAAITPMGIRHSPSNDVLRWNCLCPLNHEIHRYREAGIAKTTKAMAAGGEDLGAHHAALDFRP